MEAGQFKKRREQLIAQLEEDSGLLLFAGVPIKSSADGTYPFIANRNFEYMTGITQENSVLAIIKTKGEVRNYLFIDEANPDKERWTGRLLSIEQARRTSAIDDVLLTKNLWAKMEAIFGGEGIYGHVARVYLDLEPNIVIGPNYMHPSAFGAKLRELDATLEIKDVYQLIVRQRMIKSDAEVAAIRQAIRITGFGLNYIASRLKPHLYEHQIEGLFRFAIKDFANAEPAFDTIVASGPNATILHYPNPKDKIADGALLLCDLGARFDGYSADITRTYPASGSFNSLQKEVYEAVLATNKHIITFARPGITLLDLQKEAIAFLTRQCLDRSLIETAEQISSHYYHNVSHHLGLDTHDPAMRELPLEPGHVITVEPGLYFSNLGIGVRIEDNVLITKTGTENLSSDIPKELNNVERLIKSRS